MEKQIVIVAPMTDLEQYQMDFTLHLNTGSEMTLSNLKTLFQNDFNTGFLPKTTNKEKNIPAAGYYLSGILRKEGYHTLLTSDFDENSLAGLNAQNPLAVCISTTMVLKSDSLRKIVQNIRATWPGVFIIAGGIYVWKCFHFYKKIKHIPESDSNSKLLFQKGTEDIQTDVYIIAPHGKESLLIILKEIREGKFAKIKELPNLAIPEENGFYFTRMKEENVDYSKDITLWDRIDDLPGQIPFRTSIGCPFRCRFCDFYCIYPEIYIRSPKSLLRELSMIQNKLDDNPAILHATDDNVFINSKRVEEVCNAIIESGVNRWIGFLRANTINESNIELIKRSGLMMAIIGVESGDERQLERMNKKQKLVDVKRGIELLDQHGITVMMTYIVGYPGENKQSIQNTASFMNDLQIGLAGSSYQLFPLYISPFSDLGKNEFRSKWNIEGLYDKWKHYTMYSNETNQYGYDLFSSVQFVPYHYPHERTFYNQKAFNQDVRMELFSLRRLLSMSIIEKKANSHSKEILIKMANAMNINIRAKSLDGFLKKIRIDFKLN
ncbi:MAG: radical SAM protein [Bacteroidales bacterium]|nr:radical SAM protein [Bacteroidales bacterium]MCF8388920.1 radical SAM protein [Bacteroidales bacterium]MCF8397466.1 radical SAM protein [Bacteroidales bacterium]